MHGGADELEHSHDSEASDDGRGRLKALVQIEHLQENTEVSCKDDRHIEVVPHRIEVNLAEARELQDHFNVEDDGEDIVTLLRNVFPADPLH